MEALGVFVRINLVDMGKNGPEEAVIVVFVQDVEDAPVVQRFWSFDKSPRPDGRAVGTAVNVPTLDEFELPTRTDTNIACDHVKQSI